MLEKTMIFSLGDEKDDQIATSSARLTATICSKHWLNRTSMFKKG